MQYIKLNNGLSMPQIGLGIFRITNQEMTDVLAAAYQVGYRHFDTAQMYHNEDALGQAWRNLGLERSELFITTKVDNINQGYEQTLKSFTQSLKDLQTDYIDQFLIHWPGQNPKRTAETWKAFEKLYEEGLVKAIGLSNFSSRHLNIIEKTGNIKPMSNQIERNPSMFEPELLAELLEKDIVPIAWAPLNRGNLEHPILVKIANKYAKTPAQVALRWNIEAQVAPIPKSVNPKRLAENIDVFDFALTADEIAEINKLYTGKRTAFDPEIFDF